MRILRLEQIRGIELYVFESLLDPLGAFLRGADSVDREWFLQDSIDREGRIHRRIRILRDNPRRPAKPHEVPLPGVGDVHSRVEEPPVRRFQESEDRSTEGRLARPALAHDRDGLPFPERDGNAVYGFHVQGLAEHSAADLEVNP